MKFFSKVLLICTVFNCCTAYSKEQINVSMKNVNYRDAVSFSIPSNWVMEDEKGVQGIFYSKQENSGTLRISVFEWSSDSEVQRNEKLKSAIFPGNIETLAQGVYLKTAVNEGSEETEKLSSYRWLVALALPNNLFRLVTFMHTIKKGQESEPQIAKELEIINTSVRNAKYSFETNLKMVDKL